MKAWVMAEQPKGIFLAVGFQPEDGAGDLGALFCQKDIQTEYKLRSDWAWLNTAG